MMLGRKLKIGDRETPKDFGGLLLKLAQLGFKRKRRHAASFKARGRRWPTSIATPSLLVAGCHLRPAHISVSMTCAGARMRARLASRAISRPVKWALLEPT